MQLKAKRMATNISSIFYLKLSSSSKPKSTKNLNNTKPSSLPLEDSASNSKKDLLYATSLLFVI
jgi:hypothetical protein